MNNNINNVFIIYSNNNYSSNNNIDNSINFYKIWHNKIILKEILFHLNLFKKNYKKSYSTKTQYLNDEFRGYIVDLTINFQDKLYSGELSNTVNKLKIGGRYSASKSFNNSIEIGSIPESVKTLHLGKSFTQYLKIGYIPSSVETLVLESKHPQPLVNGIIPSSVKTLSINCDFKNDENQENDLDFHLIGKDKIDSIIIPPKFIPCSVTSLSYSKNQVLLKNTIPTSVLTLSLNGTFNQPLKDILPNSITTLYIDGEFKQTLFSNPNEIPSSVVNLNLKGKFNQTLVPGLLPLSIKTLKLGKYFNSLIEVGSIPNVETLIFGSDFNKNLNNCSIPKVKEIIFGYHFNQTILKTTLPSSLEILKFGDSFDRFIDPDTLPKNLHTLIFGLKFNQFLSKCQIPLSVKKLVFGNNYNKPFTILPPYLEYLGFGESYREVIRPNFIPQSVKTLILPNSYIFPNSLPNSIQKLSIVNKIEQEIPYSVTDLTIHESYFLKKPLNIPPTIKKLTFNHQSFSFLDEYYFPKSIESLTINTRSILKPGTIPSDGSLISLTFGPNVLQTIQPGLIPDSVQYLTFNNPKILLKDYLKHNSLPKSLRVLKVTSYLIDIDTLKPLSYLNNK